MLKMTSKPSLKFNPSDDPVRELDRLIEEYFSDFVKYYMHRYRIMVLFLDDRVPSSRAIDFIGRDAMTRRSG